MRIEIIGAESLGVRSLCCLVETHDRRIVIDPGLALGYRRNGLLPHPAQVAIGELVRKRICVELEQATDVVFSHYHGDHIPLPDANPYQLKAQDVVHSLRRVRIWAKGPKGLSSNMTYRRVSLNEILNRELENAEARQDGPLTFSEPMPHGEPGTHLGTVMMTRIEEAGTVFVHASDIQLLNTQAVSHILAWQPDVVLVGGPPLYLSSISDECRSRAWKLALQLAQGVGVLILDHHLLRCRGGMSWLVRLAAQTKHKVVCAADFMERPRCLLEMQRERLYQVMPVPNGWHEAYTRGETSTEKYQLDGCQFR